MKLMTFSHSGRTRIGILVDGEVYAASWTEDIIGVIQRGIKPTRTSDHFAREEVTLLPPLVPGKIIGVGRNYAAHANELDDSSPEVPLLFAKLPSSVIGSGGVITWRESVTQQVDWEGELAVVIGRRATHVDENDAYRYIYGYTIANDITARDLQSTDGQWIRAKGLNTFGPLGPCLVTRDEIPDPHNLTIKTAINGEEMQNASTSLMRFRVPQLVAYCSQFFTLAPGDVILTGTPPGGGRHSEPPRFLQDGDEITVSIDGIGELTNTCRVI